MAYRITIHPDTIDQVEHLIHRKCKPQLVGVKTFFAAGLLDESKDVLIFVVSDVVRHLDIFAFHSLENLLDNVILLPLINLHLSQITLRNDFVLVSNGHLIKYAEEEALEEDVLVSADRSHKL